MKSVYFAFRTREGLKIQKTDTKETSNTQIGEISDTTRLTTWKANTLNKNTRKKVIKDNTSNLQYVEKLKVVPIGNKIRGKCRKCGKKNKYKRRLKKKRENNYRSKHRNPRMLRYSGILQRSKLGRILRHFTPF